MEKIDKSIEIERPLRTVYIETDVQPFKEFIENRAQETGGLARLHTGVVFRKPLEYKRWKNNRRKRPRLLLLGLRLFSWDFSAGAAGFR